MKKIIPLLLSVSFFLTCHGNVDSTLNIGHKDMSFAEFAAEIKNRYNITIFYKHPWVETIKLKQSFQNTSLEEALAQTLQDSGLSFLVRENYVIISKNTSLDFSLRLSDDLTNTQKEEEEQIDQTLISFQEAEYLIHEVGTYTGKKKVKLYGYVKHYESKNPLKGVEVYLPNITYGTTSGDKGYYELQLPPGPHIVYFKYLGLKKTSRKIKLKGSGRIDVQLINAAENIKEVKVTAKSDKVQSIKMGVEHIAAASVKSLPVALGEADIIKSTTMLAGVESAGEGTVGFNVRGGSADQNLILVDNAPIYYPAHFFGFFPAFNFDMIKEATLYKASIPARLGGRISSAYEIRTKERKLTEFKGKVGISPVVSKIYFETPLFNNKVSLFNSVRVSYSDWVLKKIDSKELINSTADFYDLHGKIRYNLNQNNQFELSYYNSNDQFQLHSDTLYKFSNLIGSLNWKTKLNGNLKMANSVHYSGFSYSLNTSSAPLNAFKLSHHVKEAGVQSSFSYDKGLSTSFDFGASVKSFSISPGEIEPKSDSSLIEKQKIDVEKGLETALFLNAKYDILPSLTAETGLRYSLYGNRGSGKELIYADNLRNINSITDTTTRSGGLSNIYHGPEYRFSISYTLNYSTSLKASYNRTRQYIHLLSNSTAISPTDNWKLSDKYMKPQIGDQYSMGFYKNLAKSAVEVSVEAYYKSIDNVKDYKNGAQLYLNEHVETDVINGTGKMYGLELFINKKTGRVKGSASYTYSRSYFKSREKTGEFAINDGRYYPSPFDKPHNFKAFLNFNLSRRFILSSNLVYHTGRPVTYPITKYELQGIPVLDYSKRNEYRLPDYFRMDLSLLMEGSLKKDKKFHSSLSFGIYNLTGRRNAYSVYFKSEDTRLVGYKLSIFGQAVPSITYNLEF